MRCLRSILGISLRDRFTNERVRNTLQITDTITEVIKKKRLFWFGHVIRKPPEHMVHQVYRQDFKNPRPLGRPPKKWITQIREDTGLPVATVERSASDRASWRRRCHGAARGRIVLST